jgi:murein DD-endopeptidase MepM/ murein hydrolase activator NlpD
MQLSVKAGAAGPGDSVLVTLRPAENSKSLIQRMNRDQLVTLVDYLFEMDTIPHDLIAEINLAISKFANKPSVNSSVIPALEFYKTWELNNLFPANDMLKMRGDTSVSLVLKTEFQNPYSHPFNGPVTSGFGWRDSTQHNGIDIDLNKGDKVGAAFDGMVRIAKKTGGFGNVVIIRHYNGLETVYAHLSKIKVKPGQVVTAGQLIGLGGSTGHSTGSHLHFEVRFKGVALNPKYLISFSEQRLIAEEITIKKTRWGLAAYPSNAKIYIVEKGDTIFEIAKRYGTTTASIRQLNGLSGKVRLKAGQAINITQ